VALRIRQLNLLRGEVRVAESAPEVGGRLQWGDVKTHEARTIHLPRWPTEDLGGYLAGRPRGREELVFTAARGGPLRESKWVPVYFKRAVVAANETIARMPEAGRPAELPADLRFYDLRHTCASLLIREGGSVKAVMRHMGTRRPRSHWTPTGTCTRTSCRGWRSGSSGSTPRPSRRCHAPPMRRQASSSFGAGGQ
jgi:integrase